MFLAASWLKGSILLMLVSEVVPEKLPGQKGVTKKKEKNMNFCVFLTSF